MFLQVYYTQHDIINQKSLRIIKIHNQNSNSISPFNFQIINLINPNECYGNLSTCSFLASRYELPKFLNIVKIQVLVSQVLEFPSTVSYKRVSYKKNECTAISWNTHTVCWIKNLYSFLQYSINKTGCFAAKHLKALRARQ